MLTVDQIDHIVNCLKYSRQAFLKDQLERSYSDSNNLDMYLENAQKAIKQDMEIIQTLKKTLTERKVCVC